MTFPLAVFLKNLRCVTTASARGLFRIDISTIRARKWSLGTLECLPLRQVADLKPRDLHCIADCVAGVFAFQRKNETK